MTAQKPIRLCTVVNNLNVGGLEKVVLSLLQRLPVSDYELYLVCLREEGKLFGEAGLPPERCLVLHSGSLGGNLMAVLQLRSFFKKHRINLVHAHNLSPLVFGGAAARSLLSRVKVVYSEHNQINKATAKGKARFQKYAKLAHLILNVSENLQEILQGELQIRVPMRVLQNGIDGNRFVGQDPKGVRASLGISESDVVIGTAVVLSKQKGVEHLVQAAVDVIKKAPYAKFVVAGDGPLRVELEKQAAKAGLGDRLVFLGYRSDIPALLSAFDVYVLPSLWEGLPLALLEALAASKPVVCTRVGGNAEVIAHEENGLLVPPADASALADALLRYVVDPELRRVTGHRNRARFEAKFSVDAMIEAHEQSYRDVLSGKL